MKIYLCRKLKNVMVFFFNIFFRRCCRCLNIASTVVHAAPKCTLQVLSTGLPNYYLMWLGEWERGENRGKSVTKDSPYQCENIEIEKLQNVLFNYFRMHFCALRFVTFFSFGPLGRLFRCRRHKLWPAIGEKAKEEEERTTMYLQHEMTKQ